MSDFRNFVALAGAYIEVVSPAELDVSGPWSAGAWLRPNSLTGTQVILRVGTEDNGPTRGLMWCYESTQLRVRNTSNWANGTWTPVVDTWYRVGITKAGGGVGQIRHIADGVDVGGVNVDPPTDIIAGDPFRVGGTVLGSLGVDLLNAGVAWVFWLQGVTLSASALDAYLNNPQALVDDYGPSGTVVAGALKVLWPMQCDTATEEDESGVGNDGTRTGVVDLVTIGGPAPSAEWDPCGPLGPTITAQPGNASVQAPSGATFSVTATGAAPVQYEWRQAGQPLVNDGKHSGVTTDSLSLTYTTPPMTGTSYTCRVIDSNGEAESTPATLTVTSVRAERIFTGS